jgi:two-component system, OmpR family, heavy metal sensor histidine kinase CusS
VRNPISLTARISLLFAGAAACVLLIAGALFAHAVEDHSMRRDMEELGGMMEFVRTLLAGIRRPDAMAQIPLRIADSRFEHPSIAIVVAASDKTILYSAGPGEVVKHLLAGAEIGMPEPITWSHANDTYRIAANRFPLGIPGSRLVTVAIAFNITRHQEFIAEFREFLWFGVVQAGLAMAVLGWVAARRGLLLLHRFSATVATISAARLDKPLPETGMPAELHELVLAFNGMLARLQDSFRRLTEVSSDMAHELRTPLHNLLMQTQVTLSRDRDVADYRAILQSNLEEFERLSRMVSGMLFLARADNREIVPKRERVELHKEVAQLLGFYEALASDRGVRLEQSGAATVQSDRLMIQRALSNLLSNAIRFTPAGKAVTVAISQDADHATVRVENPGAQIPVEHLSKIFERLYRVERTRREGDSDNVGLGLAITKSIVEMHGGRVGAESAAGRTCFSLSLPLQPGPHAG